MISSLLNIIPPLGWFSGHGCKLPRSTCISSFNPIFQQILQAPINLHPTHSREAPVSFKHTGWAKTSVFKTVSYQWTLPSALLLMCSVNIRWMKKQASEGPEGRRERGKTEQRKEKKGERQGKVGRKGVIEHHWINELVCFPHQYF